MQGLGPASQSHTDQCVTTLASAHSSRPTCGARVQTYDMRCTAEHLPKYYSGTLRLLEQNIVGREDSDVVIVGLVQRDSHLQVPSVRMFFYLPKSFIHLYA